MTGRWESDSSCSFKCTTTLTDSLQRTHSCGHTHWNVASETTTTGVRPKRAAFVCASPVTMDTSGQPTSAARRRKQRRLRSWWRHEQQSIAAALATFQHHSAQRQKTARARQGGRGEVYGQVLGEPSFSPQAAGTQYFAMDLDEVLAASGSRPDRLAPVSGP